MEIDCVLKLGGSAITDKTGFEMLKEGSLRAAADIIADLVLARQMKVIVVHGAGSFGHPQAKHYHIKNGFLTAADKEEVENMKLGFCVTRHSVQKLNRLVVDAMINRKIPAIYISPCDTWTTDGNEVLTNSLQYTLELLKLGFVPVIHGDCVLDHGRGCNILSGDRIMKTVALSDHFKVKRVVFLTDVSGVFTKQPSLEGATLVPKIYVDEDKGLQTDNNSDLSGQNCDISSNQTSTVDVTGGFTTKLNSAIDIAHETASKGFPLVVYICKLESSVARTICQGEVGKSESRKFTMIQPKKSPDNLRS